MAVFPAVDAASHRPHRLHAGDRIWPQTNCSVDLWIEVIAASGGEPEAALGVTVEQDFEGDQFTFFKVPAERLDAYYGIRLQELAIFDVAEEHVAEQVRRGRLPLVEVDGFFLPDTAGVSYGVEHGKTTVGVNRIDVAARSMEYFHNAGLYALEGDDFDGVFRRGRFKSGAAELFLPYTEFAKFERDGLSGEALRRRALADFEAHVARMPPENPIAAFRAVFGEQASRLAGRPFEAFHKYAFNTLRQLGANFELFADHAAWLGLDPALGAAGRTIAETAKAAQFLAARAVVRGRFDGLAPALDPAVSAWDAISETLRGKEPLRRTA